MTAEVVVMNKSAIAVAADSAATVSVKNGAKVYYSANKVFALSKDAPVGIMVYGNAQFMGMPWETAIKEYRGSRKGNTLQHLHDYTIDFQRFIRDSRMLFPAKLQRSWFEADAGGMLHMYREKLKEHLKGAFEGQTRIAESSIRAAVALFFRNTLKDLRRDIDVWPGLSPDYPTNLRSKYRREMTSALTSLDGLPLSKSTTTVIRELLAEAFYRQVRSDSRGAQMVIFGFGDAEGFPSFEAIHLQRVALNTLSARQTRSGKITSESNAEVAAFAQGDMVATFMEGIDPTVRQATEIATGEVLTSLATGIAGSLPGLDDTSRQNLERALVKIAVDKASELAEKMSRFRHENLIAPIMNMIAVLPKDELGLVAETLVNLTSFKRRVVSTDVETVGGPIDVAIVSRGDGLVWTKRKHYFPPELNPSWADRWLER